MLFAGAHNMSYKCFYCQKTLTKLDIEKRIICPYCSARIIMKTRPETLKKVKAR
jgi:DNA-directed RNA polymerase subunit RPC12/RpoP